MNFTVILILDFLIFDRLLKRTPIQILIQPSEETRCQKRLKNMTLITSLSTMAVTAGTRFLVMSFE